MQNVKELSVQEMQQINGGGFVKGLLTGSSFVKDLFKDVLSTAGHKAVDKLVNMI